MQQPNNKQDLFLKNKENMLKTVSSQYLHPSTSVYSNKLNSYPELHLFKKQIESEQYGPLFKPYATTKKNISTYRAIFLGIGIIYLLLGLILFNKSLVWSCNVIFGSSYSLKALLCSFCGLIGASAILLGFFLKAEKEAAKQLFRHGKRRIKQMYERKKSPFGIWSIFSLGDHYRQSRGLKNIYSDALEKLQECRDNTLYLLDCISRAPALDNVSREELYNQAIMELKDRSDFVVKNYNTSQPASISLQLVS